MKFFHVVMSALFLFLFSFSAAAQTRQYQVIIPGLPPGSAIGTAIDLNASGTLAVAAGTSGSHLWSNGQYTRIGEAGFSVRSLNASGQAVGSLIFEGQTAFWDGTSLTTLGLPPDGFNATPVGISDSGVIAANSYDRVIVWTNGQPRYLTIPGAYANRANGVDRFSGGIVGATRVGDTSPEQAFFYDGTQTSLLSVLGAGSSSANDICGNFIVGNYRPSAGGLVTAVVWQGGSALSLGIPAGFLSSEGIAVNETGEAIVRALTGTSNFQYFLYRDGSYFSITDLLVGAPGGMSRLTIQSINSAGDLSGSVVLGGVTQPIMLRAIPGPGAGFLLVMAGVIAGRRYRPNC